MRKNLIIRLLSLIKGFRKIVILAVINGIVGNLLAMSVAIFASLTLAKALGLAITLSYPLLLSLMVLLSERPEVALESIQKHLYVTDLIIKTGNQQEEVKRVEEVLRFCHANLLKSKATNGYPSMFEIESRSRKIKIPMREVYYIETAHVPHKLLLHSQHKRLSFMENCLKLNRVIKESCIAFIVHTLLIQIILRRWIMNIVV